MLYTRELELKLLTLLILSLTLSAVGAAVTVAGVITRHTGLIVGGIIMFFILGVGAQVVCIIGRHLSSRRNNNV